VAGLERVIVGYRHHDRRRLRLIDQQGIDSVAIKKCVAGCGYPVFFVKSGQDAYMSRDPEVICDDCYQRDKQHVQAAL